MSTADAIVDLAAAQAALARITDQLIKLAGDVTAAANAAAGLVTSLEAIDADLAVATTATLAAKTAVDKALEDLIGQSSPPSPPPSPPTDALILERSNVTGPEELPLRTWTVTDSEARRRLRSDADLQVFELGWDRELTDAQRSVDT